VTRVVARSRPLARGSWLFAGVALAVAGFAAIVAHMMTPGWVALVLGGGLLLLGARPAAGLTDRIVVDDAGVSDLAMKVGPIPWADIVRAEARLVGSVPIIAIEVRNPEVWEQQLPDSLRRLRGFAAELQLPPVLLYGQGLDPPPAEIVRLINERARG
jgi:hypothetical protein